MKVVKLERSTAGLALALVIGALCLTGCTDSPATAVPQNDTPARQVRVATATKTEAARLVSASGTLAADDQIVLGTKVIGRLGEISVDLGSRVKKGQALARIDPSDYRLRVEQAQAALQQARVRLGLPPSGDNDRVNIEQTALVRQAAAVLKEARLSHDRMVELWDRKLIARAELDTAVNGENWDAARFLPFFKAAEAMGAVLFYHPQPFHNFMTERAPQYRLNNSLGVIVEDAIVVAVLILGGILEACPGLKICVAHGGGPACYAMGRLDRAWQTRFEGPQRIPQPPSAYQRRLYYDSVVGNEAALRFLLDQVGADRVVLGSDWPFVPWHPSPVAWVEGLGSLTPEEKERILGRNLEALLGL